MHEVSLLHSHHHPSAFSNKQVGRIFAAECPQRNVIGCYSRDIRQMVGCPGSV